MLKQPSAPSFPAGAKKPHTDNGGVMEVESTHVRVLADGKKLIDVTLWRPEVPASKQAALVVPQFDDESDDSSSSDDSDGGGGGDTHRAPVYNSPVRKPQRQHHDNASEDNNNDETSPDGEQQQSRSAATNSFQGDFKWDNARVNDVQQLTNANTQLQSQATEFKHQIKVLQIQLEALAPVPGLNPEMVQDILLEREGAEHDIRDAKIVHQAKTLRHLKRTLQREKQIALDAVKQCKLMETSKQQLEKEVETLKLKAARFQARAAAAANAQFQSGPQQQEDSPREPVSQPNSSSAASDTQFKKRFDDLKGKNDKLQSDFKKLQRALQREVGDDVPLDDILESADGATGKRGRAQQIVMLKAKVKKLEAELANTGAANTSNGQNSAPLSNNVDLRAQQELAGQHAQKQRLLDKVTLERDEMQEKLVQLTKKFDGIKSRSQTLEKERQESKAKFQLLVDKSKNDDALVDALQRQLETWKTKIQEVKRVRTAESGSSQASAISATAQQKEELERLRSIVAEYKRQQGTPSSQSMALSSGMPVPSEASQYRTIAAEKERLHEVVKGLQSQLEEKERQLRQVKQQQPPMMPSMLPALSEDAAATISRIPRKPGMPALGRGASSTSITGGPGSSSSSHNQQQHQSGGDAMHGAEVEALRRTFRESLRAKEDQIAALTNRLHDLESTTSQQQRRNQRHHESSHGAEGDGDLAQEVQDLQEENQFLRQEFEKLKTRYEALVKNARPSATGGDKAK